MKTAQSAHLPVSAVLLALVLALAPGTAGCRSSGARRSDLERVNDLIAQEEYDEAVRYTDRLVQRDPDDERAQELYRMASVAWRLDAARTLTFADRDEEAIELLLAAQRSAPESEVVQAWLDKTYRKLTTRWLDHALELHAEDNIEAAIEAYGKALEYSPGNLSALNGMAQAVIQVNYRKGLGEAYYKDGLRALSDYWLQQAGSRFSYAGKYAPEDDRVQKRREQVDVHLAEERVVIAGTLEDEELYGAARNEYKLALALDPENELAKEGFARTEIEAEASERLREARMAILREDYGRANALIEEGMALTRHQQELFEGALTDIEEARLGVMYDEAVSLEKDYQYPEAIAAYDRILDRAQYYRDVITRRSTLNEYVRRAGELHAEAERAQDDATRLDLLQQIEIFWPEYRDVSEQLERLRGRP